MTLTEQVKILDDKIRVNKAQYELDREAAKISALSSGELEKDEYLTGEDLGYKPDVIRKAKFEYSPLGKVFNEGLDESDKKEGLLKKAKKGKKQLQILVKKTNLVNDFKNVSFRNRLNYEAKKAYDEIKEQSKINQIHKIRYIGSSAKHHYNFIIYLDLKKFAGSLYNVNLSLKVAKLKQRNMEDDIGRLEDCKPKKKKIKHKETVFFLKQKNSAKEEK